MTMSDPIADMLTRIRNAAKAKFNSVDIPGSNLKTQIAKVLLEEGYIRNYKIVEDQKQGVLRIFLKYGEGQTETIKGLERVSRPSRRVYVKAIDIKPVLNGLGISILSTSKGIMADKNARKDNLGGEIICNVW